MYPTLLKLITVDLSAQQTDSAVLVSFKASVCANIQEHFEMTSMETATHPLIISTVLDRTTKRMNLFSKEFHTAAYKHVQSLVISAA